LVSAKEIPPGGEGKIDVTFKTQRRKGVNRKKITVNSNDPENPRLQIEIVADLEQVLDASPRRQWYGRIKQEETLTKTFTLEGKEVANVKLKNLRLKTDKFKEAFTWKINDDISEEGRKLTVDVTLTAQSIPPGRFNAILIADTNIKDIKQLELNLSGEVLGPITINPRRLYFGQFEMNNEMVKTITLTANNDIPFKIMDVSSSEAEFKIDPWSGVAGNEHTITVRLTPKLDRDRIRATLEIKTDMEKQSDVSVDIHAYKRRSRPGPKPGAGAGKTSMTDVKKARTIKDMEQEKKHKEKMKKASDKANFSRSKKDETR